MTKILLPEGAKYVSGQFNAGRLVLLRDDGTVEPQPVILVRGTLVDLGDGTYDITPAVEE